VKLETDHQIGIADKVLRLRILIEIVGVWHIHRPPWSMTGPAGVQPVER